MSDWISVEDRLPKNSGITQVKDKLGNTFYLYFSGFNGFWVYDGRKHAPQPIHWRPKVK